MPDTAKIVEALRDLILVSGLDSYADDVNDAIALIETVPVAPEPCPSCNRPPVIVADTGSDTYLVGCRQAFIQRLVDEAECKDHPTVVLESKTRDEAVAEWNAWARSRVESQKV